MRQRDCILLIIWLPLFTTIGWPGWFVSPIRSGSSYYLWRLPPWSLLFVSPAKGTHKFSFSRLCSEQSEPCYCTILGYQESRPSNFCTKAYFCCRRWRSIWLDHWNIAQSASIAYCCTNSFWVAFPKIRCLQACQLSQNSCRFSLVLAQALRCAVEPSHLWSRRMLGKSLPRRR